jgi:hypothetical protein
LFDIIRGVVRSATRHRQQPFSYGSPPGSEDFSSQRELAESRSGSEADLDLVHTSELNQSKTVDCPLRTVLSP